MQRVLSIFFINQRGTNVTRPINSKSGTPCHGAAGDAVEIQQAGGMNAFKQGLYAAGYEAAYATGYAAGYAAGYAEAYKNLDERVSSLEKRQPNHDGGANHHLGHH
jgi:hypothetical protein